jgi:toxin YoeB
LKNRKHRQPAHRDETAAAPSGQRQLLFEAQCFADLRYWVQADQRTANRIMRMMDETRRDPFGGIGKPEPLRGEEGMWSRRITEEHRLTYRVTPTHVHFLQARFHYSQ